MMEVENVRGLAASLRGTLAYLAERGVDVGEFAAVADAGADVDERAWWSRPELGAFGEAALAVAKATGAMTLSPDDAITPESIDAITSPRGAAAFAALLFATLPWCDEGHLESSALLCTLACAAALRLAPGGEFAGDRGDAAHRVCVWFSEGRHGGLLRPVVMTFVDLLIWRVIGRSPWETPTRPSLRSAWIVYALPGVSDAVVVRRVETAPWLPGTVACEACAIPLHGIRLALPPLAERNAAMEGVACAAGGVPLLSIWSVPEGRKAESP